MSTPVSPELNSSSSSPGSSATPSDQQISFKKPVKIKNELNEKRRNALKDYYKLKQQQQTLQKETESLEKRIEVPTSKDGEDDDNDDIELALNEGRPVTDIDLINSDFKTILKDTNKLTTSINFINSSIKSIIHNNYYELIRLNDSLKELNDIDSTISEQTGQSSRRNTLLDSFKISKPIEETRLVTSDSGSNFQKLTTLMERIEQLDKKDYSTRKTVQQPSIDQSVNALLYTSNQDKEKVKSQLKPLIENVKKAKGQQSLIQQLEKILHDL